MSVQAARVSKTGSSSPNHVQRRPRAGRRRELPGPVASALSHEGQPLEPSLRAFMESRFGHGFGQVRLHVDPDAARSAETVGAAAYTVGDHIVFGRGRYAPDTAAGRQTLGHELAHVVQQSRGNAAPPAVEEDAATERAADRAATGLAGGGGAVHVEGSSAPGLARQPDDTKKYEYHLPEPLFKYQYDLKNPISPTPDYIPSFSRAPDARSGFDPGQLGSAFTWRGLSMGAGDEKLAREHYARWFPLAQSMFKLPFMSKLFSGASGIANMFTTGALTPSLGPISPPTSMDKQLEQSGMLPKTTMLPSPLKLTF